MRFNAKFLRKAEDESGVVFVLLEGDKPVAVVTSQQQANIFAAQTKNRDWYRFVVNQLPDEIQPLPEGAPNDTVAELDKARRLMEEQNQGTQRLLQHLKNRGKK